MPVRRIKGATGDLYDHDSAAHHRALEKLEHVLRHIGYKVVKKIARERTLRVYPTKIGQYPLLNPSFLPADFMFFNDCFVIPFECLKFTVYSKGNRGVLHRYLKTFTESHGCTFYAREGFEPAKNPKELRSHGRFILPLRFKAKEIDFGALKEPLHAFLRFLEDAPVGSSW